MYFAEVESALEIPDGSASQRGQIAAAIRGHAQFVAVLALMQRDAEEGARHLAEMIASDLGCSADDIMCAALDERSAGDGTAQPPASATGDGRRRLRDDEWGAFTGPTGPVEEPDFIIEPTALMTRSDDVIPAHRLLGELIPKVVLAKRIREVRALVGFRRYSTSGQLVRPDLSSRPDWLPAIQVYGEGVFITLDEQRVAAWESESAVKDRAARIEKHRADTSLPQRILESATPRFIVLHTLAHLLIRRLSFDSGYAAASLRERVYCREAGDPSGPQAGILVYTAAGDIEGTMGGLVRQGRPDRLVDTLTHAIAGAVICSSDPICRESQGQGYQSLNLAACHACSLLAETSCDHGNIALDRVLVTGDGAAVPGLFQEVADRAIDAVTGLGGS